ncbi:VWA domain-containing protein [Roseovarius faecimaris]|uniref:VWA domain-containing protein n=2 Tax=Roseovarius faecimaris TaxID=2494550 RepID=A0A6I6IST6_9RHOB|nr:VWA domain-containing protein [Roseovarius faecimaris]
MLVMDGSASMDEKGFDLTAPTRIDDARAAMALAMPQIAPIRRVGLLVYGPGGDEGCTGISLRFAPVRDAAGPVAEEIGGLIPGGMTPLAASVEAAADVLGSRGIIVLVTDGNETCGGRPCALGRRLAEETRLTVHVIGFRVAFDPFAWNSPEAGVFTGADSVAKCLSDATGGMYVNTETVEELAEALRVTLGCDLIGMRPSLRRSG